MHLLITGSSGFIGQHLCSALLEQGHRLRRIDRRHGWNLRQLQAPQDWHRLLHGIDAVINAAGIIVETVDNRFDELHHKAPVALFEACRQLEIPRIVQISALGADADASSAYHLSKKAADDHLHKLGLNAWILRPSLVVGRGSRSQEWFRRLAGLPILCLPGGGRQCIQPIAIQDLVDTIGRCLTLPPASGTLDLVGPQSMLLRDWILRLRQHLGKSPTTVIDLPYPLATALSRLLHPVLPLLHPDNIRMLRRGNCADQQPLEAFLGHPLRPVEPAL